MDLRRKHYVGVKTRNFTTVQEAKEFANGIAEQVSKTGLNGISAIGTDARIKVWSGQLAVFGKTVEDAIDLALKHFASEKAKMETPYAAELLSCWVDDKITNPLKPLRPRSLKAIRVNANAFKRDFGTMRIAEIDRTYVEQYIKKKDVSNQTRKNKLNLLSQFFNWAIYKQHITIINPTKGIEINVVNETPKFFTVEQCVSIMTAVKDTPVMSYYAICLFAGVRPDEAKRMTWDNVLLNANEIALTANITKTKKPRLFTIEDNLVKWLNYADNKKPLIPVNQRKLAEAATNNINFDWIQDGMRHTFCTMHYAKYSSMEALRKTMGNSPSVIDKFYKGTITKSEVEKFWKIMPHNIIKPEVPATKTAAA